MPVDGSHLFPSWNACARQSFYAAAEFSEFCCPFADASCDTASCFDPNSCDPLALPQWVARSDLFTTPHITYFDSAADAVRIMEEWARNPERRSEVIEAMQSHLVQAIQTSSATLQDAIRTIRHAAQNKTQHLSQNSLDESDKMRERAREWSLALCRHRESESYDFLV